MDPKEQLRQVEEEMARDEAEAKRLSRPDAAGGMQPHGSGQRPSKGRVYWLAVFMLLISAALSFSRGMSDKDLERLQMALLTGGSGLLIGYVLGRRQQECLALKGKSPVDMHVLGTRDLLRELVDVLVPGSNGG